MPNINVINKLVRPWGGSVMPDCQPLSSGSLCPESSVFTTFLGWLSLTGTVAQFAPEWWLSMVRIIHAGFMGIVKTA